MASVDRAGIASPEGREQVLVDRRVSLRDVNARSLTTPDLRTGWEQSRPLPELGHRDRRLRDRGR